MYNIIPSLEKIEEKLDQLYDKAEDILEIVQECCDNEEGQVEQGEKFDVVKNKFKTSLSFIIFSTDHLRWNGSR